MLVALSIDMEGASHLGDVREVAACCDEYWHAGKPALEADVVAAAAGLLAGGASEIVLLDNHASGNTFNVSDEVLPPGVHQEGWNVFDLHEHGVDAMFQLGYHARADVEGFLSHTYAFDLQLRVGDELISESHGRAWAAAVPLLGIVGNDAHEHTLGSLAGTPFLAVQTSRGRNAAEPVFVAPSESYEAIRGFAERCARHSASVAPPAPPMNVPFAATMPNGESVAAQMEQAGWRQTTDTAFETQLKAWQDGRGPLAAAMSAAMAPVIPCWQSGLSTREKAQAADKAKTDELTQYLIEWANQPPAERPTTS